MAPKKKRTLAPAKKFAPPKSQGGKAKHGVKKTKVVEQAKKMTETTAPAVAVPSPLSERLTTIDERLMMIETRLINVGDGMDQILTFLGHGNE